MKTETTEREHHPFSPSTLQYREACPYFEPSKVENAAATAGTLQHVAVDSPLDHAHLSDAQAAAVKDCQAYFNELKSDYPGCQVLIEQYLPIDDYRGKFKDWNGEIHPHLATTAGYLDRAIVSKDRKSADICDWKFGEWDVEPAENNVQGISYLLGIVRKIPSIDKVTVRFVMPYRDEITYHTFHRPEFQALHQRIRAIVFRAVEAREKRDFTQATPCSACIFCANAGRCDALTAMVIRVGQKFSPLQIPEDITPTLVQNSEQSGLGLRLTTVVTAWAQAYRAQKTVQALESGVVPDGYSLVGMSERKIIDPEKLREVCVQFGLTEAEVNGSARYFITTIDELIRAKAPRGSKDAAIEVISQALLDAGAIEKTPEVACLRMKKK
jgi:hypothetical protein